MYKVSHLEIITFCMSELRAKFLKSVFDFVLQKEVLPKIISGKTFFNFFTTSENSRYTDYIISSGPFMSGFLFFSI